MAQRDNSLDTVEEHVREPDAWMQGGNDASEGHV